jgi:hypothetical protein
MHYKYLFKISSMLLALLLVGCAPNESILRSNSNQPAPESTVAANAGPAYDTVESEVENMRNANFDFILVLRRRDGGVMQSDDKAFVRSSTPNVNRRSLVDGDKAIVLGANAETLGDVAKKLSERFEIQDFSKAGAENKDSNAAANANITR